MAAGAARGIGHSQGQGAGESKESTPLISESKTFPRNAQSAGYSVTRAFVRRISAQRQTEIRHPRHHGGGLTSMGIQCLRRAALPVRHIPGLCYTEQKGKDGNLSLPGLNRCPFLRKEMGLVSFDTEVVLLNETKTQTHCAQ